MAVVNWPALALAASCPASALKPTATPFNPVAALLPRAVPYSPAFACTPKPAPAICAMVPWPTAVETSALRSTAYGGAEEAGAGTCTKRRGAPAAGLREVADCGRFAAIGDRAVAHCGSRKAGGLGHATDSGRPDALRLRLRADRNAGGAAAALCTQRNGTVCGAAGTAADGHALLGRGQCVDADRRGIGSDHRCAAAQRRSAVANCICRIASGERVVTLHQCACFAIGIAAGLELAAGLVGNAGHRVQLALVHRIGGFSAGCNMGHLALTARPTATVLSRSALGRRPAPRCSTHWRWHRHPAQWHPPHPPTSSSRSRSRGLRSPTHPHRMPLHQCRWHATGSSRRRCCHQWPHSPPLASLD